MAHRRLGKTPAEFICEEDFSTANLLPKFSQEQHSISTKIAILADNPPPLQKKIHQFDVSAKTEREEEARCAVDSQSTHATHGIAA